MATGRRVIAPMKSLAARIWPREVATPAAANELHPVAGPTEAVTQVPSWHETCRGEAPKVLASGLADGVVA